MLSLAFATLALGFQNPPTLSDFLRTYTYPLTISDSQLGGTGADALLRGIEDARFVCIGEEHFIQEVPHFAQALFARLNREKGFGYLVTENDPFAVRMIEDSPERTDAQKIRASFFKQYPNLIAFAMAPEIELLAFVNRTSKVERPVWGLDQNIGALHILDRLFAIAPTSQARKATGELIAKVKPIDSKRAGPNRPHYMSSAEALPDIQSLRSDYGPKPGSEADRLLDWMQMSATVYSLFWKSRDDPTANFSSNVLRERYMKSEFAERYRAVAAKKPKLLLKFGMNHMFRGVGLSAGWFSLGNFISELASYEGSSSIHIAIMTNGQGGQYSNTQWAAEIRAGTGGRTCLIDLRPARVAARSGQLNVSPQVLAFLDGFDFAVLVGNPTPMTLDSAGL